MLTNVLTFSLGSTRFFKVARARHKGALVVVKVFVLHDPTLPLVEHKEKLEHLNRELSPKNNCLPFAKPIVRHNIHFNPLAKNLIKEKFVLSFDFS